MVAKEVFLLQGTIKSPNITPKPPSGCYASVGTMQLYLTTIRPIITGTTGLIHDFILF